MNYLDCMYYFYQILQHNCSFNLTWASKFNVQKISNGITSQFLPSVSYGSDKASGLNCMYNVSINHTLGLKTKWFYKGNTKA